MADSDGEDDSVPLNYLRPFGAGLKRKRIEFVRASSPSAETENVQQRRKKGEAVANAYLAIVMPRAESTPPKASASVEHVPPRSSTEEPADKTSEYPICKVCKQPIKPVKPGETPHELSIVHQISMPHSHPPSSVDRNRRGLAILSSHGWDPDARQGLGAEGDGRLYPVKAEKRHTNLGIGAENISEAAAAAKPKLEKLNAAQMRRKHAEDKEKAKRLARLFYGSSEVNKHLGLEP